MNVGVRAVTVVVRQAQLAAGEIANTAHLFELFLQGRVALRVGNNLGDWERGLHDFDVAANGMRVVIESRATGQDENKQQVRRAGLTHEKESSLKKNGRSA